MTIDQKTLAFRLKDARGASHLTQEQVAMALGLPRTAIAQIEAGHRAVSTLELARLSGVYGRSIASFFNESAESAEEDVLVALFRAVDGSGKEQSWKQELSRYLDIYRNGMELKSLLDQPHPVEPPTYELPEPRRTMEAVDQGNHVAVEERRRLGLGHHPIPDISDLINRQHVWASGAQLPEMMSGLFLKHPSIGLCILVNHAHSRARKRFSYAHEYAHALLDRQRRPRVSLEGNRSDLTEVRANAFAAAFLLPSTGVWEFLQARFKAGPSLCEQTVYDPAAEQTTEQVRAQKRAAPRSQTITYEDVAAMAHHFGVSYQAAVFRFKGLSIINDEEFQQLREKEQKGREFLQMLQLLNDIEGQDQRTPDREIVSQVLHLALEAYRREEISKGKLLDLSTLLRVPADELLSLAEAI